MALGRAVRAARGALWSVALYLGAVALHVAIRVVAEFLQLPAAGDTEDEEDELLSDIEVTVCGLKDQCFGCL